MRYGVRIPKGWLPVYSVADEQEAKELLVLACPLNQNSEYVAPHLAEAQTLENLQAFSDHLAMAHAILQQHGRCRCVEDHGPAH